MNLDVIRQQLAERLKLRKHYSGLQSGDGVRQQIRDYHKLHELYDEHDPDKQIEYLLAVIDGLPKVRVAGGISQTRR